MSWTIIIPENVEAEIDRIVDDDLRNEILDKLEDMEKKSLPPSK